MAQGPASLETILGSCVSVCMWDSTCGMGGMNHIMLPTENNNGNVKLSMYAHGAVDVLVEKLQALGCRIKNLSAKVFGGGIAIKDLSQCFNVGVLNVEAAINRVKEYDIPIVSEYTGAKNGIRLIFHPHTGRAFVKELLAFDQRYNGLNMQVKAVYIAGKTEG